MAYAIRFALVILVVILANIPASAQQIKRSVQQYARGAANQLVNRSIGGIMRQGTAGGAQAIAQNMGRAASGGARSVMMLPEVSTSSIDLNTCDMDFIGGRSRPSYNDGGGSGASGNIADGYPPPPGPGYQPMTQHGQFVGWYSPEEVALSQSDFPSALVSILRSDRYYGGITGAASILYEIGKISSPFAFDEAAAFLGK